MTADEKYSFDRLNKVTYLCRLAIEQTNRCIVCQRIGEDTAYYVCKDKTILFRLAIIDDDVVFYIQQDDLDKVSLKYNEVKFTSFYSKAKDKFEFDDFFKYISVVEKQLTTTEITETTQEQIQEETKSKTIEVDEEEYNELKKRVQMYQQQIMNIFLKL